MGYNSRFIDGGMREVAQWPNVTTTTKRRSRPGCGTGRFTRHLCQLAERVVAVDVDEAMLDKTRTRVGEAANISYHALSAEHWSRLPSFGSFDAVIAMRVIPHCDDWQAALRSAADAIRPEGLAIFDLWNRRSFVAWLLRRQGHDDLEIVHRLTPAAIRSAVEEYRAVQPFAGQIAGVYQLVLLLFSLVVVLFALWWGLRMARGVTGPLRALAEGTGEDAIRRAFAAARTAS